MMFLMILLFCNVAIYVDDTTFCAVCVLASDLWQQLELTSKLGSNPQYTVDQDRGGFLNLMLGRLHRLVCH